MREGEIIELLVDETRKQSFVVMMEIGFAMVMKALPSFPVLSVIRRVDDVIIGGTHMGRPVGEIRDLMTRFMTTLFKGVFMTF